MRTANVGYCDIVDFELIYPPILMIFDLFARSDYCYSKFGRLNFLVWLIGFGWIFWRIKTFFINPRFFSFLIGWHYEQMDSPFLAKVKGSYTIIGGRFFIILGSNIWGLFPYIFGVTTQIAMTFTAAWIIWLAIIWRSGEFRFLKFLSHFIPLNSPNYLAPFLSVIELVRNLIRPFTLSLRLGINITTGHILLGLMSSNNRIFIVLLMVGYLLFETGIGFIQGFVFSLLVTNYLSEHV